MEENNYGISIKQIFNPIIKRLWIVILIALLLGAAAFGYTHHLVTPMYESTARVGLTIVDMSAYQSTLMGQTIAKDCAEFLMSDITLNRAADRLNSYSFPENEGEPFREEYSNKLLYGMVSTQTAGDVRFFDVTVKSPDPKEAEVVCRLVVEAFGDALKEEDVFVGAKENLFKAPNTPTSPASPNKTLNTIIGALIGALITIVIILIVEFSKDSIDGEDWLISVYKENIPMLAVIPDANLSSGGHGKYYKKYGYGYSSEKN